jgi:hypothetical protein
LNLTAGLPASLLAGWLAKCPSLQPRARLLQLLEFFRWPPDAPCLRAQAWCATAA